MKKLVNAIPGDEFYFEDNRERIFTMLKYITRPNGLIYACRIIEHGKLYSIYLSAYRNIIITKTVTQNEA